MLDANNVADALNMIETLFGRDLDVRYSTGKELEKSITLGRGLVQLDRRTGAEHRCGVHPSHACIADSYDIRRISLTPRSNLPLMTAAERLGMTLQEMTRRG